MSRRPDLHVVPSDVSPMGMHEGVRHFLDHIDARGAAANTVRSYGCDLQHYLRFIDRLQSGHLVAVQGARTVSRFIDDQNARGIGKRSQARRLSTLRMFFKHARREGWIGHDPTADERVKFRKRAVIAPEMDALHRVIDAIPATGTENLRDRALLRLMLDTALRISAMRHLDAPGYGSGTAVDVKRQLVTYIGKGGDHFSKPYNDATGRMVEQWLSARGAWVVDGTPALFVSRSGERLSRVALHRIVVKRGKAVGLKLHAHLLRHRRGAHVIERCDLKLAQQFLDHADISTTSDYGLRADNVAFGLLRDRADIDEGRHVA